MKKLKSKSHEETTKKEIESILRNSNYILWLQQFTENHHFFTNDSWLYNDSEIKNEDLVNVLRLNYFFKAIENYSGYKLIPESDNKAEHHYIIIFNNISYIVGKIKGINELDAVFYCQRTETSSDAIQFINIASNYSNDYINEMETTFEQIFDAVDTLNSRFNIPKDLIVQKIDEKIAELNT